jgi:mannose-1-phosphate guanylyltransferase
VVSSVTSQLLNISVSSSTVVPGCNVIVLAGGEGDRLRELTTNASGELIPKQYCSINRNRCLLQDAVFRARAVAGTGRVWPVVARKHERWWRTALTDVDPSQIVVQPQNRGTAFGILLGLLNLQLEGVSGTVLILPADQHVDDEQIMLKALKHVTQWAGRDPEEIYLLGAQPEEADPALGYILPWFDSQHTPIGAYAFIERPQQPEALKLINRGALWNTFIIAASLETFLRSLEPRFERQIESMRRILETQKLNGDEGPLNAEYLKWPSLDFSQEILQQNTDSVQVLRLPACGWTELGTVSKIQKALLHRGSTASADCLFLDLAKRGSRDADSDS